LVNENSESNVKLICGIEQADLYHVLD